MARLYSLKPQIPAPSERREDARIDVAIWGRIKQRNGDTQPARISNLSSGGFMAMTPAQPKRYSEIDIEIPMIGWRSAMIAWIDGDKVGGEFEPPLEHGIIDRIVAFRRD